MHEIALALLAHAVDERIGGEAEERAPGLRGGRGELRVEQLAVGGEQRRVDLDGDLLHGAARDRQSPMLAYVLPLLVELLLKLL